MVLTKPMKSMSRKKTATKETGTVKTAGVRAVLDHPQQGEKINSSQYTFRAGTTGDVERVEISINQGPWQVCRYSVGYWWYDWSGYAAGRYQAAARAQTRDGRLLTTDPAKYLVVLG